MKLSLFEVVMRPIKTSRKLLRLMKEIELEPKFKANERVEAKAGEYTVLTNNVLMPTAVFNMINASLVRVEMDGYSPVTWKRHKSQDLSAYPVAFENAVAMMVAERLEEAHGKNS